MTQTVTFSVARLRIQPPRGVTEVDEEEAPFGRGRGGVCNRARVRPELRLVRAVQFIARRLSGTACAHGRAVLDSIAIPHSTTR